MLPRVCRQHASMHPATVMFSCAHSRARARPVLTESLCVLHLQVNLARLLNGLGDTSLLHPDDSALGITVQRSELYDSLMLELRQEKEKNDQLRADLKKRCIDDRSVQGAIEPVRTELEMQHRDDLKSKLAATLVPPFPLKPRVYHLSKCVLCAHAPCPPAPCPCAGAGATSTAPTTAAWYSACTASRV